MTATFENTVSILVKAYLDGALLKGDCHACAVGNLCAAALGHKVKSKVYDFKRDNARFVRGTASWDGDPNMAQWVNLFATGQDGQQERTFTLEEARGDGAYLDDADFFAGEKQLLSTGYTVAQLADIEFAFETAQAGFTEEAEFAGLMAVVDVLADIHHIDLAAAESAKLLFVRA